LASALHAAEFYVAPNANANGNGSIGNPWRLQTALDHPSAVHPGDTIWLRGGTYNGTFASKLNGTASQPIIVRQYPGERATIDGGASNAVSIFSVFGSYTWFWGFEVMSSDPVRFTDDTGSWPSGSEIPRGEGVVIDQATTHPGLKFINMVVHDAREGFSFWKEATTAEIYGCLSYYNGWEAPDRGHGHNIYAQNQSTTKYITDSILFSGFSHNIHIYGSSSAFLNNFHIEGTTTFNAGDLSVDGGRVILLGGDSVAQNPTLENNYLYRLPGGPVSDFDLGYNAGCSNATVTDNYIADNSYFVNCSPSSMTGNTFYGSISGFTQGQYPNNTYLSNRPTGVKVFIRPNAYEAGRAHITIFNWNLSSSVDVDLSSVLSQGSYFELRNAQNYFGPPAVSGTYDGNLVTVPMAGLLPASPVGWAAPPPTGPEFNAFVLTVTLGPGEFFDVPQSNIYHDAIHTLAVNGITAGCGPGYFCPDASVLRSEMSVFLLKSKHGSSYAPPAPTGTVFDDVPAGAFAAAWIEQIAEEGITAGCTPQTFCPNAPVSRAQMAVFLLKTSLGSAYTPPQATGTVFSDVHVNTFAAAWIEDLAARGLTVGCGGGKYCPDAPVSRGEMAALLVSTFDLP
jgi:hypothetical protein